MSGKTTVMKPGAAIAACFGKFARCYGRSCRAEFIWFLLFFLVLGALAVWFTSPMIVGMLWALLMIPLSSVGIRRLHDLHLPGDGDGARACVRADDAADARLPDGRLVPQKERPAVGNVFLQKRV